MFRLAKGLLLLLLVLMSFSQLAAVTRRGIVEVPWTPTACLQGSHFLEDPCTGFLTMLKETASLDLDPFDCQWVDVVGPNIGIECEVIQPDSVSPASFCPNQFTLWLTPDTDPIVEWYRVPCAVSYDVIRGNLSLVSPEVSQIDLGPVSCFADNTPQISNNYFVTGPTDADTPPVGGVYFYLVRSVGSGIVDQTYGHSSDNKERIPFSGDCFF